MRISLARLATIAMILFAGAARAAEPAEFNAAVEQASAHNRVAIGYLRTGNTELAALEIERMRAAWAAVTGRFGRPPEAFAGVAQLYTNTLLDVSTRLVAASLLLDSGRPEAAGASLDGIRAGLAQLRKAAGVIVLADCVRDANATMDALMIYNDRALDWSKAGVNADLTDKARRYDDNLTQCDGIASQATRNNPEFRRLIDGAKASLGLVAKSIETRDADLLHRVLIELRSFDNLLAFRFG